VLEVYLFYRITCCCIPYQSKWIYVGTERGNVHMCGVENFILSGYNISWNKAIELYGCCTVAG